MLMDLESGASRVFSVMKKKADSLMRGDGDDDDADVVLSDSDVRSIKKFFVVSCIRTEFYRSYIADPNGVFPPSSSPIGMNDNWIRMLRLILENSPETLVGWKGDGGSDSFHEATTRAIRLYQIISNMQLHIWRTSDASEEFMLGADHLVHIDGLVRDANDPNQQPKTAHMLLPISPSVVVIACDSDCCRASSALSKYQHTPPREHVLPGRKKPGQKGYRPARNVWKYHITRCEEQQMLTINARALASSRIVFRNHTTFKKFVDSITTTIPRFDTSGTATAKDTLEWLRLYVVYRKEHSHVRAEIIWILCFIISGFKSFTRTQPPFNSQDYLVSRGLEYGIIAVLESLNQDSSL